MEMTVSLAAVRVGGQTGFDGLLKAGCEARRGANWTGKGGERIEWAERRCARVAVERVRCSTVLRRERDGHSSCYSQKNKSEERKGWSPWKMVGERKRGRYGPGSRRRSSSPDSLRRQPLRRSRSLAPPSGEIMEWKIDDDVGRWLQAASSGTNTSWSWGGIKGGDGPARVKFWI
jgi:hypothetical protein